MQKTGGLITSSLTVYIQPREEIEVWLFLIFFLWTSTWTEIFQEASFRLRVDFLAFTPQTTDEEILGVQESDVRKMMQESDVEKRDCRMWYGGLCVQVWQNCKEPVYFQCLPNPSALPHHGPILSSSPLSSNWYHCTVILGQVPITRVLNISNVTVEKMFCLQRGTHTCFKKFVR